MMPSHADQVFSLKFSEKYNRAHAEQYLRKHNDGLARRLPNWRDQPLARKALKLAGEPDRVLDLPCGAGRFLATLSSPLSRTVLAADYSADMLEMAKAVQPGALQGRLEFLQTSAFAIELADNSVDSIFCMRLLHHVQQAADRLAILREFYRVSRDTVIISLWVDGNFKAWRRRRLEVQRAASGDTGKNKNRFVVNKEVVESEFDAAGFRLLGHFDFLPGYAMWRVYVLRKV